MHIYARFSTCLLSECNIGISLNQARSSSVSPKILAMSLRLLKSNSLLPNQLLQWLAVATDSSPMNLSWSCMLTDILFLKKEKILFLT